MDNSEYYITYYETPSDEVVIWRYLDLAKFISLLKDKALFMTRADKFDDQFEGAVARIEDAEKYDEALAEYYYDVAGSDAPVDYLIKESHRAGELIRRNSYVNCWCEGEHESMAMWRLYASVNEPKGVAIKSTVGQLKKAIGREIEIGRIGYIDYSKVWLNPNEALWRKRLSFEYEHEIRIRTMPPKGLSEAPLDYMTLPVDLEELIESVYVSPMAEPWFRDVVLDVMKKYGIEKEVFHSGLESKALY